MKEKYKAAFIIPVDALKTLGENGWEFETSKRISIALSTYLIGELNLRCLEKHSDFDSYISDSVKMTIIYDDDKLIESIYFQLIGDSLPKLKALLRDSRLENFELFIPSEIN